MPRVGTVREIWRYPVKSMEGESLLRCKVGEGGVVGDRWWALRDEQAGEIRGAKKLVALLECVARYREEPAGGQVPQVTITLPDGTRLESDEAATPGRLSEFLGREVTLWPLRPAADTAHYRRGRPDHEDMETELRDVFAREADEPLPDLSLFPPEIFEFTSPPGTYFDALPLHLLTTSSLATMAATAPQSSWDVRRFRPNLLIDTGAGTQGLVETAWCGRTLRLGAAEIRCEVPTPRCGVTTRAQRELPKDPGVLRTIVREAAQNLGVYGRVTSAGAVAVGDPVAVV